MKKNSAKNNILLGFLFTLLVIGCGLKANPAPKALAVPQNQIAQKLTALQVGTDVVLTWRLENTDGKIGYVNVERSQLGGAGNICRNCPRTFASIGRLTFHDVKNEYRFTDSLVEKGNIYNYRLKLCDKSDVCRESQTVEIDYK